jgi:LPXTG-motif cell wall-anchored protein
MASDTDQCDVVYTGAPNLKIEKHTVEVELGDSDGTVTWKITVGNFGGSTADVVVVDERLPKAADETTVKVAKKPTKGKYKADDSIWKVGSLAPGEVHTMTMSVKVPMTNLEDGVVNRATVTSLDDPYITGKKDNKTLAADTDQYDSAAANADDADPSDDDGGDDSDETNASILPDAGGPYVWVLLAGLTLTGLGGLIVRRSRKSRT